MKYANIIVRAALSVAIILSLGMTVHPANAVPLPPAKADSAAVKKKGKGCSDPLVAILRKVGFKGHNLREAWAISMRESHGHARAVSPTHDYGLFQFNYAAWHNADWWSASRLLTPAYNATVAYRVSRGGKTWYPWDINGKGQHLGRYSSSGTYAVFKSWYDKYPCEA